MFLTNHSKLKLYTFLKRNKKKVTLNLLMVVKIKYYYR
jgi:hypothetical protein